MSVPMPYLETTDPAYGERAATSFSINEVAPGTLQLRGPCPRCGDHIEVPVVSRVYRANRRTVGSVDVPVDCTCKEGVHPGQPEGASGCGAYWNLQLHSGAQ